MYAIRSYYVISAVEVFAANGVEVDAVGVLGDRRQPQRAHAERVEVALLDRGSYNFV